MDPPLHTTDILAHTHTNQTLSLGDQHGDGPTWGWANRACPTLWGHVPTSTSLGTDAPEQAWRVTLAPVY